MTRPNALNLIIIIKVKLTNYEAPHYDAVSHYFSLLGKNIPLSTMFSDTVNPEISRIRDSSSKGLNNEVQSYSASCDLRLQVGSFDPPTSWHLR